MNVDELIRQIKGNENYWSGLAITPQQIDILRNLPVDEYAKAAIAFLQEPVADYKGLQGVEYRKTYAHLIYGAFLCILRPNSNLYSVILASVIEIGDPTSIKYGAAALRQVKPVEQIVSDLFTVVHQYQNISEILHHIAWLFYWLGFSEQGSWQAERIVLSLDGGWENLYSEHIKPESNPQEIANIFPQVAKFMRENYTSGW
jgi:hypothetical protein